MKPKCLVIDIDGVLLDTDFIHKEIMDLKLKDDEKWAYFHKHCNSDRVKPLKNGLDFVTLMNFSVFMSFEPDPTSEGGIKVANKGNYDIILSTARNEICRKETEEKLKKSGIIYKKLYMRDNDDKRLAIATKEDHIKDIMKDYDIVAFIDDDLANCNMAKAMGLLALRAV